MLALFSCSTAPVQKTINPPSVFVPSVEEPVTEEVKENVDWQSIKTDPVDTALTSGKFVLMFFYAPECQPCSEVLDNINDPSVADGVNDVFFPVKIDISESREKLNMYYRYVTPAFRDYPAITIPAVTIVSGNGKAFTMRGIPSKKVFIKIIDLARKLEKNNDGPQESVSISKGLSARR